MKHSAAPKPFWFLPASLLLTSALRMIDRFVAPVPDWVAVSVCILAVAGMSAHAFAAIRAHTFNNQSDAR